MRGQVNCKELWFFEFLSQQGTVLPYWIPDSGTKGNDWPSKKPAKIYRWWNATGRNPRSCRHHSSKIDDLAVEGRPHNCKVHCPRTSKSPRILSGPRSGASQHGLLQMLDSQHQTSRSGEAHGGQPHKDQLAIWTQRKLQNCMPPLRTPRVGRASSRCAVSAHRATPLGARIMSTA